MSDYVNYNVLIRMKGDEEQIAKALELFKKSFETTESPEDSEELRGFRKVMREVWTENDGTLATNDSELEDDTSLTDWLFDCDGVDCSASAEKEGFYHIGFLFKGFSGTVQVLPDLLKPLIETVKGLEFFAEAYYYEEGGYGYNLDYWISRGDELKRQYGWFADPGHFSDRHLKYYNREEFGYTTCAENEDAVEGEDKAILICRYFHFEEVVPVLTRWLAKPTEAQVLRAVQANAQALADVPNSLKTPALCLAAVKQDGRVLEYVPKSRKTAELCLTAIQQDAEALEYVPESLKTAELCLAVVQRNGEALKYVPKKLQTEEICLAAVQQNSKAFEYVAKKLQAAVRSAAGKK